jgi:LacI family transcriptional regulator
LQARVTIKDVARLAGVSISTVSRVLNDTCPVGEDKRLRVEQAVEELGFTPHPNARGLSRLRTGGIGVVVPSISGEFFSEFLTSVDDKAQELGYYLLISASHRERGDFRQALASMYGRVDGLIVVAPGKAEYDTDNRILKTIPSVLVNETGSERIPSLGIQNEKGFGLVTDHILSKGHVRVALIRGPKDVADARERTKGFRKTLHRHGIADADVIEEIGDFTRESGYEAVERIFSQGLRPTAILAQNDLMALGAMSYLFEIGVRVPDDVIVSGFDDVAAARYSTPSLTTVRVPIRSLGELAMARLHDRLRGHNGQTSENKLLPVHLVPRASTGD